MNDPVSVFESVDDERERALIEQARADIRDGKGVPHERVREWLLKLVDGDIAPPPTA